MLSRGGFCFIRTLYQTNPIPRFGVSIFLDAPPHFWQNASRRKTSKRLEMKWFWCRLRRASVEVWRAEGRIKEGRKPMKGKLRL